LAIFDRALVGFQPFWVKFVPFCLGFQRFSAPRRTGFQADRLVSSTGWVDFWLARRQSPSADTEYAFPRLLTNLLYSAAPGECRILADKAQMARICLGFA
jgi:hypothetical protein